jgi:AAA+ superfamily predicted ATPase
MSSTVSVGSRSTTLDGGDGNADFGAAFVSPLTNYREQHGDFSGAVRFFVFMHPNVFMENNPYVASLLHQYIEILPSSNVCVVLVTPDAPLPIEGVHVFSLPFETPGFGELRESLHMVFDSVRQDFADGVVTKDEEIDRICNVGAGMSKTAFEAYSALALVEAGREGKDVVTVNDILGGVTVGKTDIVNSNDILELYPTGNIANVGGMENLKDWIRKRSRCYSDEAREFGIEPPKGMVFVGPPGTGKSLAAKAVSGVLGVPLVRLDFGRVFNSLIGASEQRMRTALKMVEAMAPCVLFCDEIDKGLGGIGGSSDGGTSNRVLGSFLTWLNDCQYPVFTMVTANNIDHLPPELLRRGRFDEIFSTSLPTPRERKEVLAIHLSLRNRDMADYDKADVQKVIDASNRYVPAEIEAAVKDGLINAFDAGEEFEMDHVYKALTRMVPLSKAFEEQIARMNAWATNNATPASASEEQAAKLTAEMSNRRRISNRKRS